MKRSATSLIVSTVMLCTVGATSQIQAADTLAKIKSTGKIVIGHRESSDPISYVVAGKPVGYAVDICNQFANDIKKELKMPDHRHYILLFTTSFAASLKSTRRSQRSFLLALKRACKRSRRLILSNFTPSCGIHS